MTAAGSIVEVRGNDNPNRSVFKTVLTWLSDTSGVVSGIPIANVDGVLSRVTFISNTGGTQPTDLYDVTLLDDDGVDVLAGLGANVSRASAVSVAPMLGSGTNVPVVVAGNLSLTIANAGNAKGGSVSLYFRRGSQ